MGFDAALKKYFSVVILGLTAVAAYFQASGVTQLVGAKLGVDEKGLVGSLAPVGSPSSTATLGDDHSTSARLILDRNPFDSVTPRPLDAQQIEEGGSIEQVADLEHYQLAPPCEGLKALIIAASDADPAWSMAALSGSGANASQLVRPGDDIGGKTVHIIEWNRVVLSQGPTVCQVQMFRPANAPGPVMAPVAEPTPAPNAGRPGSLPADIASKIQRVSATEFHVDRQVVDKILENQAELMRSARIVPEQENGKIVGIRLFGLRPDTLLGALGMENGDRLQTINGFDMTSPEKALEAYARLRTADKLTVQVNRRGQNVNLDFMIK